MRASFWNRNLTQTLVYWPPSGEKDEYGKTIFGEPIDMKCRYEQKLQKVVRYTGEEVLSKGVVYSLYPLHVEGIVWQGDVLELESGQIEDPLSIPGAELVISTEVIPPLRGTGLSQHKAYL